MALITNQEPDLDQLDQSVKSHFDNIMRPYLYLRGNKLLVIYLTDYNMEYKST